VCMYVCVCVCVFFCLFVCVCGLSSSPCMCYFSQVTPSPFSDFVVYSVRDDLRNVQK
jgi:hypothetical protein